VFVQSEQTRATRHPALSRVSDHYSLHSSAIYGQSKPAVIVGEPYLHGGQDADRTLPIWSALATARVI
jgi:hypothetical protein